MYILDVSLLESAFHYDIPSCFLGNSIFCLVLKVLHCQSSVCFLSCYVSYHALSCSRYQIYSWYPECQYSLPLSLLCLQLSLVLLSSVSLLSLLLLSSFCFLFPTFKIKIPFYVGIISCIYGLVTYTCHFSYWTISSLKVGAISYNFISPQILKIRL